MLCSRQLHFPLFLSRPYYSPLFPNSPTLSFTNLGLAMAATAKNQAPKPRKRVDFDSGSLKRATNGSAFIRCENCNKDIPVATADMHDCRKDAITKARLMENVKGTLTKVEPKQDTQKGLKKRGKEKKPNSVAKKSKSSKDPNMPKRPMTAFFIFMEDFRKEYKEQNPSAKKGNEVAKLGGERWKEMTDEEKEPYTKKAADFKSEYETSMKEYNGKKNSDTAETGEEEVADNIEPEQD